MQPRARIIAGALLRFTIVYALLTLPWPGWKAHEHTAEYLRSLISWTLVPARGGLAEITVAPYSNRPQGMADTRIEIANRALLASNGAGPVRRLDLDLGRLGAASLALLLSLIVATPISWKRRALAAAVGVIILHAAILGFLKYCIWAESAEISLVMLSAGAREIAGGLKVALIAQFSMTVPVLIWILASFRREDQHLFSGMLADGEPHTSPGDRTPLAERHGAP